MSEKNQKTLVVVILAASVGLAAVLGGMWYYDQSKERGYDAVVDVKVYGPGWLIVAEDVGVDNATALSAVKSAGKAGGFEVDFIGTSYISSINGTQNDGNVTWHYGLVSPANGTAAARLNPETGTLDETEVHTGSVLVLWYTDDPLNNTPILGNSLVTVDVLVCGPGWTIASPNLVVGLDNTTALDALRIAGRVNDFEIETIHYVGFGDFVSGINGTSGNMTHFWLFGVNGVSSDVGADSKMVSNGDTMIFWFTDDWMSQPPGV